MTSQLELSCVYVNSHILVVFVGGSRQVWPLPGGTIITLSLMSQIEMSLALIILCLASPQTYLT